MVRLSLEPLASIGSATLWGLGGLVKDTRSFLEDRAEDPNLKDDGLVGADDRCGELFCDVNFQAEAKVRSISAIAALERDDAFFCGGMPGM